MTQTPHQNALRRERELRGWSQRYVAEQIEAPAQNYISRWERGEILPSPYYRAKLCHLFDKNAQELGLIQVQEETTHRGSSSPELTSETDSPKNESASDGNILWFAKHKRSILGAFLLLLVVASFLSISWPYFSPPRTWPPLQYNLHVQSAAVRAMQYMLIARGYDLSPYGADGVYGPVTENAVRSFQEASHLSENNGVDDPTWEHLIMPSEEGNRGSQVQALQVQLNDYHIVKSSLVVDGIFGLATEQAVRQFQQINHLPVTGKADIDVWCLLVGGHIHAHFL